MRKQRIIDAFKRHVTIRYSSVADKNCIPYLEERFNMQMDNNVRLANILIDTRWNIARGAS